MDMQNKTESNLQYYGQSHSKHLNQHLSQAKEGSLDVDNLFCGSNYEKRDEEYEKLLRKSTSASINDKTDGSTIKSSKYSTTQSSSSGSQGFSPSCSSSSQVYVKEKNKEKMSKNKGGLKATFMVVKKEEMKNGNDSLSQNDKHNENSNKPQKQTVKDVLKYKNRLAAKRHRVKKASYFKTLEDENKMMKSFIGKLFNDNINHKKEGVNNRDFPSKRKGKVNNFDLEKIKALSKLEINTSYSPILEKLVFMLGETKSKDSVINTRIGKKTCNNSYEKDSKDVKAEVEEEKERKEKLTNEIKGEALKERPEKENKVEEKKKVVGKIRRLGNENGNGNGSGQAKEKKEDCDLDLEMPKTSDHSSFDVECMEENLDFINDSIENSTTNLLFIGNKRKRFLSEEPDFLSIASFDKIQENIEENSYVENNNSASTTDCFSPLNLVNSSESVNSFSKFLNLRKLTNGDNKKETKSNLNSINKQPLPSITKPNDNNINEKNINSLLPLYEEDQKTAKKIQKEKTITSILKKESKKREKKEQKNKEIKIIILNSKNSNSNNSNTMNNSINSNYPQQVNYPLYINRNVNITGNYSNNNNNSNNSNMNGYIDHKKHYSVNMHCFTQSTNVNRDDHFSLRNFDNKNLGNSNNNNNNNNYNNVNNVNNINNINNNNTNNNIEFIGNNYMCFNNNNNNGEYDFYHVYNNNNNNNNANYSFIEAKNKIESQRTGVAQGRNFENMFDRNYEGDNRCLFQYHHLNNPTTPLNPQEKTEENYYHPNIINNNNINIMQYQNSFYEDNYNDTYNLNTFNNTNMFGDNICFFDSSTGYQSYRNQ